MAGLVPAIHEFSQRKVVSCRGLIEATSREGYVWPGSRPETVFRHYHVDGRDKPGHDADSGAQDWLSHGRNNEYFRRLPVAHREPARKADRGGRIAAPPRSWPLRRRAAARGDAWRPLDQRGH